MGSLLGSTPPTSKRHPARMKTTRRWQPLTILLSFAFVAGATLGQNNPHQPLILTWQVLSPDLDQVLYTTSQTALPGTWWPDLAFCLKQIIPSARSTPPNLVRSYGFYCCPEHSKQSLCGGPASYYCSKWSCVTSNDGDWKWASGHAPDMAEFSFQNLGPGRHVVMELYKRVDCRPGDLDRVLIKFTDTGKTNGTKAWIRGMRWGVVFYNYYDSQVPGSSVMIRLSLSSPLTQPVGPNPVLAEKPSLPLLRPTSAGPPSDEPA